MSHSNLDVKARRVMTRAWTWIGIMSWGLLATALCGAGESAAPLRSTAPSLTEVREKVQQWTSRRLVDDELARRRISELWTAVPQEAAVADTDLLLQRVLQSFAVAHPETRKLLQDLSLPARDQSYPDARSLLGTSELGPFYQANLRLWYGKSLAQRELFEEALEVLLPVELSEVVDPASYLFYRAVCEKSLFLKPEGLATLEQLLTHTQPVPERYRSIGEMMRTELTALEEKSLGEVATKMSDVRRRLKLARAGQKVQQVEQQVVDLLDELIKQAEEEQQQQEQQQQQSQGEQSGSEQQVKPADESRIKGSTAPGDVDTRKLKPGGNWGNITDKERAKARNIISRDFPPHYRQAIEEYFKKLATREAKK